MKFCLFMPTTIEIDTDCGLFKKKQLTDNKTRLIQYTEGITSLLNFIEPYDFDVVISDNSDFLRKESLIKKLLEKKNVVIVNDVPNKYGGINKGSGIMENWLHNKNLLKNYEYIIHFEPRQLLQSDDMIKNFLLKPRNLITYGKERVEGKPINFNMGLFAIESKILIEFIEKYHPNILINGMISLEYIFFEYLVNNKIKFDTVDKMGLIWYDSYAKDKYYM